MTSLLDLTAAQWRDLAAAKKGTYRAFLLFARDVVEVLAEGSGWEVGIPATCGRCTGCRA